MPQQQSLQPQITVAFTTGLNSHSCEVHDTSASDSALPSPHSETQAENHRWSLWQEKRECAEPVLVALEGQRKSHGQA